jgi:redox-sensitive bicupin YhaK (pirin superfamily)
MSWRKCPDPTCESGVDEVEMVIAPKVKDLGGFEVRRALPSPKRQMVGPFVFFDHFGPTDFAPGQGIDVRPHPHIGISTVTYLFEGEIFHRDSLGNALAVRPGEINWMTAGRGIAHSERTGPEVRRKGGRLHGIQAWVALPDGNEEVEPDFEHFPATSLPQIEKQGVRVTVIAGTAYGETSPVNCRSDILYADAVLAAGGVLTLPDRHKERGLYVAQGEIAVGEQRYGEGSMVVIRPGADSTATAAMPSRIMIIGGDPPRKPRYIWWNLVSSSRERIEQAKAHWREGKFSPVPGETEFIPLPEE